jgi:dihydroorotate dehydrogenase
LMIKVAIPPGHTSPPPILASVPEFGLGGAVVATTERRSEFAGAVPATSHRAMLEMVREVLGPQSALIAVGGIRSAKAVGDRLAAGADLVQVFRTLIFDGPAALADLSQAAARAEIAQTSEA